MTIIPEWVSAALIDPEAYAAVEPLDRAHRWLRGAAPLAKIEADGVRPFWAVTRFNDIQDVEKRTSDFHNGDTFTTLLNLEAERIALEKNGTPNLVKSLVSMDPPDHLAYRRLTQDWFQPRSLRGLEERIREIAREAVDRMAEYGGRCDFAKDVAFAYPLRVIMEVLGVPQRDEAFMLQVTQELFGAVDPDVNRSGSRDVGSVVEGAQQAIEEMGRYFVDLCERRRRDPRNDIASAIANGLVRGNAIGIAETIGYYIIIATAGHDTTSNTLAGGLWALIDHPDQLAKVKARPELIPSMVEETFRWVTPVKHFMRSAVHDTQIAGVGIAKDDWLMLCYPSGNRDESAIERPYEFDIERGSNKHVAFGYGAHICLGQHLARMELRLFWEELLPRLDFVALDGEPKNTEATFVSGVKKLPIRYRLN